jgi:hypothetical protein
MECARPTCGHIWGQLYNVGEVDHPTKSRAGVALFHEIIDRLALSAPGHTVAVYGDRRLTAGELRSWMDNLYPPQAAVEGYCSS